MNPPKTLQEALQRPATPFKGRKATHPLIILFGALQVGTKEGMEYVCDRGAVFSDLWERYPQPHEVTWGEVIRAFELAKANPRLNSAWCDEWILTLQERIFD